MGRLNGALNRVRERIHQEVKDLPPSEFKEFLENLAADLEGSMDALKDENPELFE